MHLQSALSLIFAHTVICLALARFSEGWLFSRRQTPSCYRAYSLGCFDTSYPHHNSAGMAPQAPNDVGVSFHRYTSPTNKQTFTLDDAREMMRQNYDPTARTIVIIHGYFGHVDRFWITEMVNELLQKGERNVIAVDWNAGASSLVYFQSVANTRIVGAMVAVFLQGLVSLGGDPASFHIIGFSLGAHVAGHAGTRLRGIGRITGLDPARPSFEGYPPETRLDPTDALLVDVIHTDGSANVGKGTLQPMGTVDFYPNGGKTQPGCPDSIMDMLSVAVTSFDVRHSFACSHMRATHLFSASINQNCTYRPSYCPSFEHMRGNSCVPCRPGECPVMGYNLDSQSVVEGQQLYRTVTTGSRPYCGT